MIRSNITKEEFAYLLIDSINGIRAKDKLALICEFGNGEEFMNEFKNNADKIGSLISESAFLELCKIVGDREKMKLFYAKVKAYPFDFVVFSDENYPSKLKELEEPPFVLYYQGNLKLLDENVVFLAGTRGVTNYGVNVTKTLTKSLVENELTILTGVSDGIDTIAIETALAQGGSVIAVLAGSFDKITPVANEKLIDEIISNGLVITESLSEVVAQKYHYVFRNRIFATLADVAVLIEADSESNATNAVLLSAKYGKEIFAVPGNLGQRLSKTPNQLIADDVARCLVDPRKIVEIFKAEYNFTPLKNVILTDFEQSVLSLLDKEPLHFDILCEKLEKDAGACLGQLLLLEAKNKIRKLPGNFYEVAR